MKWIGVSGSRKTNAEVEHDVRAAVREIIARGDGIVTGGALGVDYFATDEALQMNSQAMQILVYLPVTLMRYAEHYRKRANESAITQEQAETLIQQLTRLKNINPSALVEHPTNTTVDQETYYERNRAVVDRSDKLLVFQVNGSAGTQDAVDKARGLGKEIEMKQYTVN